MHQPAAQPAVGRKHRGQYRLRRRLRHRGPRVRRQRRAAHVGQCMDDSPRRSASRAPASRRARRPRSAVVQRGPLQLRLLPPGPVDELRGGEHGIGNPEGRICPCGHAPPPPPPTAPRAPAASPAATHSTRPASTARASSTRLDACTNPSGNAYCTGPATSQTMCWHCNPAPSPPPPPPPPETVASACSANSKQGVIARRLGPELRTRAPTPT